MMFFQVCEKLSRNEGIKHWDDERRVPYLVAGNQWIGYDDEDSFAAKVGYNGDCFNRWKLTFDNKKNKLR